jgi:DNA-binding CsgD family transcriptional regulator/tetratricopeptide (TPR) repeat protein
MVLVERFTGKTVRYRLLETLREYGKEKLVQAGEQGAIRQRHAEYFVTLSEAAERKLIGPEQAARLTQLDLEYDNLRAALAWSGSSDPELGLRLAVALTRYWLMRGLWSEGRARLKAALDTPISDEKLRARGLLGAGTLAEEQGDFPEANDLLNASLTGFTLLGDLRGVASAGIELGRVAYYEGDLDKARTRLEEGLALGREAEDRWAEALALTELGQVAWRRGAHRQARDLAEQGVRIFRELDDRWNVAYALDYMGHGTHGLKEFRSARRLFEETLAMATEIHDLWGIAHARMNLGDVALDEGQLKTAESHLIIALHLLQDLARPSAIAATIEAFAGLAAAREQLERSITLEGAAAAMRERFSFGWRLDVRGRVEGWLPAVRTRIGEPAATKAERRGGSMDVAQTIAYALEGTRQPPQSESSTEVEGRGTQLTRREIDVASLIAKGLTNREIAARLFISGRTAETHVDRILAKLDFHAARKSPCGPPSEGSIMTRGMRAWAGSRQT